MKEIRGNARTIRELLGGETFSIDYYQREYNWEKKQLDELITDLADKFDEKHDNNNQRTDIKKYPHYFLGSIIISEKNGKKFIIDGQQRLTTLTLLLIFLYQNLDNDDQKAQLSGLIYSQKFGERNFNLDVNERNECMKAIFEDRPFDVSQRSESVANLMNRYEDINDLFPDEIKGDALPFFSDWLIWNVHFVEITASSDEDAYTIFETMNDRGLSLTPTDMLKGYLLANIQSEMDRSRANDIWKKWINTLEELGPDEGSDAIKAWLRSQHALTIRERKRGAQARDFGVIGTEFHRWVRDKKKLLNLVESEDFFKFISVDFDFYSHWYQRIRKASISISDGLEEIYYNAKNNFTLQYAALLAPLDKSDDEEESLQKIRIVSKYIDIMINRRIWNWRTTSYNSLQYNIFQLVILNIRGKTAEEIVEVLSERLKSEQEKFSSNDHFSLTKNNSPQVHRILARLTDFIEVNSGRKSRYLEYSQAGRGLQGLEGYEIEHIWPNHPERYKDEFEHANDFEYYRNRIGGLLLLPKSFNASYGDNPYEQKIEQYYGHNMLAQTLNEKCYEHDPGFNRFKSESGLDFTPHKHFNRSDLDQRQILYGAIAERIWNPENLIKEIE